MTTMAAGVIALAMPAVEERDVLLGEGQHGEGRRELEDAEQGDAGHGPRESTALRPVASTQIQHPMAPIATRSVETVSGP